MEQSLMNELTNIIHRIATTLDVTFVLMCNICVYLTIKTLEDIKLKKSTSILFKRIITFIIGIILGIITFCLDKNCNIVQLFYSFIFSLFSFDYIFKPILKKFKCIDYKKKEDNN